jgi:tRNA(fMet)-specific endonuclease VapC
VADHIADVGEANVLTSVIVACELRYGAAKRGSRKLTRQVEAVLSAMTIRPLESDADRVYAPFVWRSSGMARRLAHTTC